MVLDVLDQHRHLGVEVVVLDVHALELAEQDMDDMVLFLSFLHHRPAFLIRLGHDGRVEDVLLDRGVDLQLLEDLSGIVPFFWWAFSPVCLIRRGRAA